MLNGSVRATASISTIVGLVYANTRKQYDQRVKCKRDSMLVFETAFQHSRQNIDGHFSRKLPLSFQPYLCAFSLFPLFFFALAFEVQLVKVKTIFRATHFSV